ncbi:MAG: HAD family hydrolase [Candidatus Rokubacteria bacterium]|nr:HAD family hydrolase [Candidatus Rokubacteria bacterium]
MIANANRPPVSVLVTDLDNTLFDWVDIWYRCFNAMLTRLVEDSGVSREQLLLEFRQVHQRHATSEYAFAIQELPSLLARHPGEDLVERYHAAIDAYRQERRTSLRLYTGVMDTLSQIRAAGAIVIGYTESMAYYSNYRLRRLSLDGVLDYLYSPADHDLPGGLTPAQIRAYPASSYELRRTVHRHTPRGVLKPDPAVLVGILADVGANLDETIYVGDNLMKDVVMAKHAGVTDVWARYGVAHEREAYELLRSVSHWTDEAVLRDKTLTEQDVKPTHVLENAFDGLLDIFTFVPFTPQPLRQATDERRNQIIDVWKKVVDVQQHFNDLELRVRNLALTGLVALVGFAGFVLRERVGLVAFGIAVPLASLVLLAGLPIIFAFWLMDRFWYHRLLYGAVTHGREIEQRARLVLPELGLTDAIGRASPIRVWRWELRSPRRIDLFYAALALTLVVAACVAPWITIQPHSDSRPSGTRETPSVTRPAPDRDKGSRPSGHAAETAPVSRQEKDGGAAKVPALKAPQESRP